MYKNGKVIRRCIEPLKLKTLAQLTIDQKKAS